MKLCIKLTTLAVLASIIGTQCVSLNTAFAQENIKVLPPVPEIGEVTQLDNYNNSFSNAPLKGRVTTVPSGTVLTVNTNSTLTSGGNQVGDIFTATLVNPINLEGNIAIPEGSELIGQVTYVENAGRVGKNAVMQVKFTSIKLPNDQKIPITAKISTTDKSGMLKGGSLKRQLATTVATGAVSTGTGALAGLGIGSLMGSAGGGALFGTTVGGVFGLGYLFARKGKDVILPAGTGMNVTLEQPVTIGR